jgi:hypothetical protein
VPNKIEQVWHLLKVRGHVRIVAPKMHVVEDKIDDMLDISFSRLQAAFFDNFFVCLARDTDIMTQDHQRHETNKNPEPV